MRNQRVRSGTPTENGSLKPKKGNAVLGVGAQNGAGNQEARQKLRDPSYHTRDAVDEAVEADRRFFRRRLDRAYRVRIASAAEIVEMGAAPPSAGARWFVVVKQVVPGARVRLLFPCYRDADTDVSEARCAAIYAALKDDACDVIETVTREVL